MIAKKSKGHQSSTTAHYPFIFTKAKKSFTETIQGIKERALDFDSYGANKVIQDIIKRLGWNEFYKKPDEGVLQLLKEFYANLEERINDKVFVRG